MLDIQRDRAFQQDQRDQQDQQDPKGKKKKSINQDNQSVRYPQSCTVIFQQADGESYLQPLHGHHSCQMGQQLQEHQEHQEVQEVQQHQSHRGLPVRGDLWSECEVQLNR